MLSSNHNTTQQQLLEIQEQNGLMRRLATRQGFFQYYFKELSEKKGNKHKHRTMVECFNYCNEKFYDLFGEYKYSSYNSFKQQISREYKK